MAPYTLTDLIVPVTCILTSTDIAPERENILSKSSVPEECGNRRECNDVGEAIAGPSTMNIDQSASRHFHYQCHCYDDTVSYNGPGT